MRSFDIDYPTNTGGLHFPPSVVLSHPGLRAVARRGIKNSRIPLSPQFRSVYPRLEELSAVKRELEEQRDRWAQLTPEPR